MNMITLDIHDGYSKKIIQITRIECEITSNALNTLIFVALKRRRSVLSNDARII